MKNLLTADMGLLISTSKPQIVLKTLTTEYLQSGYKETVEGIENDLDRMELPASIRWRIQAAMPLLAPWLPFSTPCHLPMLSPAALTSLQPSTLSPGPHQRIIPPRTSSKISGRSKSLASQDPDVEIDPGTLLEEGTNSASSLGSGSNIGSINGDHSNLKACRWLKGTVRVRRTDLTYIGALDEDS